jgi:hypothetical protein
LAREIFFQKGNVDVVAFFGFAKRANMMATVLKLVPHNLWSQIRRFRASEDTCGNTWTPNFAEILNFHEKTSIGAGWIVAGIVGSLRQTGEHIPFGLAGEPKPAASSSAAMKVMKQILQRHIAQMPLEGPNIMLMQAMSVRLFDALKANRETRGLGNLAILKNAGVDCAERLVGASNAPIP